MSRSQTTMTQPTMTQTQTRMTRPRPAVPCAPLVDEPLDAAQAAVAAPMFKALGDPGRLRLLSMIASAAGGEVCVCDLAGSFALTGPTISHHLKVLREAGLVDSDRRGTWVYYRPVPAAMAWLAALLQVTDGAAAAGRTRTEAERLSADPGAR